MALGLFTPTIARKNTNLRRELNYIPGSSSVLRFKQTAQQTLASRRGIVCMTGEREIETDW